MMDSTMGWYPVQRHKFPSMASLTWASVGDEVWSSNA